MERMILCKTCRDFFFPSGPYIFATDYYASVVQRIEFLITNQIMEVRFLPGVQAGALADVVYATD